jgi:hypothetical protein
MGSRVAEHRGEQPPIHSRYYEMQGLQKTSAKLVRRRGSSCTGDTRMPQGREYSLVTIGPPDYSRGLCRGRVRLRHLRAKKLPYGSDGE